MESREESLYNRSNGRREVQRTRGKNYCRASEQAALSLFRASKDMNEAHGISPGSLCSRKKGYADGDGDYY